MKYRYCVNTTHNNFGKNPAPVSGWHSNTVGGDTAP